MALLEKNRTDAKKNLEHTFREDYEIGVYGNQLVINYSGKCLKCGLTFSFERKKKLDLIERAEV